MISVEMAVLPLGVAHLVEAVGLRPPPEAAAQVPPCALFLSTFVVQKPCTSPSFLRHSSEAPLASLTPSALPCPSLRALEEFAPLEHRRKENWHLADPVVILAVALA